jgi:hypothetical protein
MKPNLAKVSYGVITTSATSQNWKKKKPWFRTLLKAN